ncbi:hypothetical protein A8709_32260 [Paenibacillus pectinilyticus]|uniref:Uncharacterized protein n=1 Tax=Paenibacillus pectinilyticus TaxID=512399 RepID=A0A1C0ZWN4_9BACL|nr:hypothetical protein [Paenibacillus pectinilyticus]OCT12500.1 hypothetical protein A8709_32260 [Paenibacillus pectinilyticus]
MEKRLTRTDYLFALMFIFMLVCILGAFFYGLRLGQTKSDQKYDKILHADQAVTPAIGAYDQQVLVSYYHTIFLPFREFQNKWFELMSQIEMGNATVDASAVLKELYKIADEKYGILKSKNMPDTSPLLVQSHQGYLKSLKLFADSLNSYQAKANGQSHAQLIDAIQKDPYFLEAKTQALTAQKNYFDSILAWDGTLDPDIEYFDPNNNANLDQWRAMNLNVKNVYITAKLLKNKAFSPFYPQDLTIRIDEFIASGQAKKLNVNDVNQTMELLLSTNAVRTGDFVKGKSKWYTNENLPQLPFFSDVN